MFVCCRICLGAVVALWIESRTCNPKVTGSSLRSVRNCRWGEKITRTLSTLNTTTPGHSSIGCPLCVHLDGLNAEHKFQVWDTRHFTSLHTHKFNMVIMNYSRCIYWHLYKAVVPNPIPRDLSCCKVQLHP